MVTSKYLFWYYPEVFGASLVARMVKHQPAMQETRVRFLGREDPLEKEMAIHSSTLACKIPWTEEPDRLQSTGSQRVGHDWGTSLSLKCEGGCGNRSEEQVSMFLLLRNCGLPHQDYLWLMTWGQRRKWKENGTHLCVEQLSLGVAGDCFQDPSASCHVLGK